MITHFCAKMLCSEMISLIYYQNHLDIYQPNIPNMTYRISPTKVHIAREINIAKYFFLVLKFTISKRISSNVPTKHQNSFLKINKTITLKENGQQLATFLVIQDNISVYILALFDYTVFICSLGMHKWLYTKYEIRTLQCCFHFIFVNYVPSILKNISYMYDSGHRASRLTFNQRFWIYEFFLRYLELF